MRYAVIMAGGSGTRLWPMSTKDQPKQLIPFIGGRSLIEVAMDRLDGLVESSRQLICTGESLREPIKKRIPEIDDAQIIGEPEGRDTLNAVGFAAAVIAKDDPDAVIAVFTADHLIEPVDRFQSCVDTAFEIAEEHPNSLVTFGITPTFPATGYGYIHLGEPFENFDAAREVQGFKEKPDEMTAQRYLERGMYLWNSGMFVWRASTLLDCIERYQPEAYEKLMKIQAAWGTVGQDEVLNEIYPTLPKISVDYAVMEPAGEDDSVRVVCVNMPVRWLDVGSWPAFGQTLDADAEGNRVAGGPAELMETSDTLIVSDDPDHLIAAIGIEDLVVVHTAKATLICHKDAAQRIKEMHAQVGDAQGDQYL